MRHTFFRAALAAALVGFSSLGLADQLEERRELARDGRLQIINVAGDIEIRGWDRPQMHLIADPGRSFKELKITGDDQALKVEVIVDKGRNNVDETDLVLQVPFDITLSVNVVSGDIGINALRGPLELRSVSGDVAVVAESEQVRINTVSGDIELSTPSLQTRLGSVSGDIEASRVLGILDVESVSGSVQVDMQRVELLDAKTVSGDLGLRVSLATGGRVNAETLSGTVSVQLPKDSNAQVKMRTFSGDVEPGFGHRSQRDEKDFSYSLGNGNGRLDLSSFSGDIEVRGH